MVATHARRRERATPKVLDSHDDDAVVCCCAPIQRQRRPSTRSECLAPRLWGGHPCQESDRVLATVAGQVTVVVVDHVQACAHIRSCAVSPGLTLDRTRLTSPPSRDDATRAL